MERQMATLAQRLRAAPVEKNPSLRSVFKKDWMLYAMLVPALVMLILFHFYPMWGILIAFKDYKFAEGILGSPWIGWQNFQTFFASRNAGNIIRNTVLISMGKIVLGQVTAVVFALMLNEVRPRLFKRLTQTATTLPHFLSWVIIGGIMIQVLGTSGLVNKGLTALGLDAVRFLGRPSVFPWTLILSDVWKGFGFGAVIYLAALTGINPELFEAAAVDGAGRFQRIRYITLPSILPTIILMACLALGSILNAGFDQVLVLYNPSVMRTGDIIDTYVYRVGLIGEGGMINYGLASAVGLMKSVIGFFLIVLSYWLAGKFANYRIF
jgi:putative aldouronate transport system permease protein